jgi:hypothetical protein
LPKNEERKLGACFFIRKMAMGEKDGPKLVSVKAKCGLSHNIFGWFKRGK